MDFLQKLNHLMDLNKLNKSTLSQLSGIPYTTIDAFYKKGYQNTKLSTIKKIAKCFDVTLDYLLKDEITDPSYGKIPPTMSFETYSVAQAYEKADFGTKNAVRKLLDLSPQTETSREISIDDEIEAFRQELIAEQKGTTSSASGE